MLINLRQAAGLLGITMKTLKNRVAKGVPPLPVKTRPEMIFDYEAVLQIGTERALKKASAARRHKAKD